MSSTRTAHYPLTLDATVDGLHLESASISEALGEPFHIELLIQAGAELKASSVLGQPMTIGVDIDPLPARHFHGLVSEVAFLGGDAQAAMYRVALRPWLWFLSRAANCRIFQQKSVPDIIKAVFREHGFADFEEALHQAYAAREFVVQYAESDLNFVSRLMQEAGIYYYFKHEAAKHTLVLCDSLASHEPLPGYEELLYMPPDRQRDEHVEYVHDWAATSRIETTALATKDFDFQRPLANLTLTRTLPLEHAHGGFVAYDYPGKYTKEAEGDAQLRVRLEEQAALLERCTGQSNARGLAAGRLFTLQEHPLSGFNREYLILSTAIRLQNHDLRSGGSGGEGVASCEFVALDSQVQFRSPRTAPRPLVHGAQTAIVVGPAGEEIWTDPYGRVKVKFHWDRAPGANENSSCWIRVSQLWAGSGFGGMHVPRIGQEVIVEFLEGDPDRPIITGRVYNGSNAPPWELPIHQTQSGIRTNSSKGGRLGHHNELRFEDAAGQEEVYLRAERDQNVEVVRNRATDVGKEDALTVGAHRRVQVKGNLEVSVGSDGGVYQLAATDSVTVTAPHFILLKCGDSSLRIEPDRITITSGTQSRITLDADVLAQSSGGSNLVLDSNVQASASGQATLRLDQHVQAQSAAAAKLVLNANAAVEGASVLVKGQSLVDVKAAQVKVQ